jgi:cytochrome c5
MLNKYRMTMKNINISPCVVVAFFGIVILACSSPKAKVASAAANEKATVSTKATPKLALVPVDEKGNIIPVDPKIKEKNLVNRMTMLTDAELKGKDLYDTRCAECHDLPRPQEYNKEKWAIILDRMKDKAQLDDKSFNLVKQYSAIYFEN